ncbi:MAG: carboxypeptidase regulatory-like domain-containing protein [Dokdonella sp.]
MNKQLRMRLLPWVIGSFFAVSAAYAQNTSSSLSGRVLDASGHPVAGATVEIIHVPSGTSRTVIADSNGRYGAQGLRVGGPFEIKASGEHGENADQPDVYLKLAEETTLNLTVGAASAQTLEGIVVTAVAPGSTFQSDNKGLSTNISGRDLKNAPAPSRSIQDVARLDPRIVVSDRGDGSMSANGQNSRFNRISVDSVNVGDPFGLNSNGMPYVGSPVSVDTIEEYNLSTANFDVSSDTVGANINAVTKSGTNEFHGSAYYAYRNAHKLVGEAGWLPSDNQFYDYKGYGIDRTAGVTLGGPIIKDKLFFFLSYEDQKTTEVGADAANGLNPSLTASTSNQIAPADLQRAIDIAHNLGLSPGTFGTAAGDQTDKRLLAKIDWNISDNHRANFSYQRTKDFQPIVQGNNATSIGLSSYYYFKDSTTKSAVLHVFDDWSDNFSTETTLSRTTFSQFRSATTQQPQVQIRLNPDGTGPTINLGEDQFSHYNAIDVKGWNGFFAGTYTIGNHSIKGGFDYASSDIYNLFGRTQFGSYLFWGLDNFAAGNYRQFDLYRPAAGLSINDVAARWKYQQWGVFLQDTWQVNDILSVQYGVRTDIPQVDDAPRYNPAFQTAFGIPNNSTINNAKLFEPRVSFNLDLDGERTSQLRGGFGLFQSNPPTVWLTNPYQNNGLTTRVYSCQPQASNTTCTQPPAFSPDPFHQGLPPAGSAQMAVDAIEPGFKLPSVWKTSLALDHKLPWWNLIASAEFEHLTTENGILYQNLNLGLPTGTLPDGRNTYFSNPTGAPGGSNRSRARSNPAFAQGVTLLRNTDKGSADSLTLSLKKPFDNNWSGNVAVTLARATEVNPGTSSQATSNFSNSAWVNPGEDVTSPANGSIKQRLSASLTWQHNFFGDYATAVSAFYDGHTGNPYSWTFGNDANGDSYSGSDLAYIPRVGDVAFTSTTTAQQQQQFFDFIKANPYLRDHQGLDAGRNRANSPWVNEVDLSFRQEVPGFFPSGAKGELRFDIFNFMNLLNKDWGQQEYVGFPYNRTLANYQGVGPDGHMIYSLPTDSHGNYQPGGLTTYDAGRDIKTNVVSRWSMMITLRYTF